MLKYKIVADSSSNLFSLSDVDFAAVPLKIITEESEYVDDTALDIAAMVADLETVIELSAIVNLDCDYCKYMDRPMCEECEWEWRGVCEENTKEDEENAD